MVRGASSPGATDWPEERRAGSRPRWSSYLLAAAAERRAVPRDDIVTELWPRPRIDGDRLTDAELGMFLVQLLVAGNETTRNLMSGGLVGFAEHPGEWARLRSEPDAPAPGRRGDAAVDDAGGGLHAHRHPDTELARTADGRRASRCSCSTPRPTATRRCSARPPTAFDIARDPNPHVTFGFGPTSASAPRWPASRPGGPARGAARPLRHVGGAGPVVRTPSSVIAGVRRAPLCFGVR